MSSGYNRDYVRTHSLRKNFNLLFTIPGSNMSLQPAEIRRGSLLYRCLYTIVNLEIFHFLLVSNKKLRKKTKKNLLIPLHYKLMLF